MKTKIQKSLSKIAPNICIETIWTEDQDAWSEWRELSQPGNCFHNEDRYNWQPWQSEIRAACISDCQTFTGSEYLGGTWERAGDNPAISNPDISGYEKQMTEEALESLLKDFPLIGHNGSAAFIREQINSALQYLSTL